MSHLLFTLYILALLAGSAAVLLAAFLYIKHKSRGILYFGLFLLALVLFLLSFTLKVYQLTGGIPNTTLTRILFLLLQSGGGMLMVIALPRFTHILMGRDFSRTKRAFFHIINGLMLTGITLLFFIPKSHVPFLILAPCLYGTIAYCLLLMALHRRSVRNPLLKKALKVFFYISLIFFPLFLIDILDGILLRLPFRIPGGNFSLLLYFLIITTLSIRFALQQFNHPAFIHKGTPSRYFREIFGITEREAEIITHLLQGLSNKEISEQLHISFKTVENHIYNIYQKTLVSNRIELFNLILTNQ